MKTTSSSKKSRGAGKEPASRLPGRVDLDIETFSSVDLTKSGVYRYAEAPDFQVLLIGYSLDGGPVKVADLASGQPLPEDLRLALLCPTVKKWAFNAMFERVCLSRLLRDLGYLGAGEFLPPVSWRCAMVWSAYLGLPQSLAGVGTVLGLEKQKLETGKDLIRYFCMPARERATRSGSATSMVATPRSGACSLSVEKAFDETSAARGRQRHFPSTDPERWQQFVEYNIRDVESEQEIMRKLSRYPVPESVWKEYEMDQFINDRGIRVDREFAASALAVDALSREELTGELSRRTEIENPNSVSQVREWLAAHGQEAETLSKKQVRAMLEKADPEVREVLLLRMQLAKTSVKKYAAMENSVCVDGRVRGMFQFYGAARSGRWAGRIVQLQNLPQNHLSALSLVRGLVLRRDYGSLKMLYDSVPDVLSELIRTAFIPAPGKKFIVCDFSAIEARVIAWLAGESWRQEVFAAGGDIYCASASAMFKVPVEKHGVNAHLRQKGKIAELALGYGGGTGALVSMGALEMGLEEKELQPLVDAWRSANPNICRLWWNVDSAAKAAVRNKTTVNLFGLRFSYRGGMLHIILPSGRALSYVQPRFTENRFGGESVSYMGMSPGHHWEPIESYGPKFVENIVQGIARDLLVFAMQNLSSSPCSVSPLSTNHYPLLAGRPQPAPPLTTNHWPAAAGPSTIVAHVHDEVILEADPGVTVEEISRIMSEPPAWAKGLLLRADGYECGEFYRKE